MRIDRTMQLAASTLIATTASAWAVETIAQRHQAVDALNWSAPATANEITRLCATNVSRLHDSRSCFHEL